MKVMIVARGYPTDKYKMNGIFEFDQAKALVKAGIDVTYIAIDVRSIRRWRKWGFERKIIDGVKILAINVPCGRVPQKLLNEVKIWALRKTYKQSIKIQGEPDIIHAHFIGMGYIAAKVFQESKIPLILTEHYSGMNQEKISSYYKKLGEFTYPRMNKVIAVSKYLGDNIEENFNVKVEVIPNIVDLFEFTYKPEYKSEHNENFNFISVGRLHKDKRMDYLIDSFRVAFKENKNVKLVIFGEGIERKKIEEKITRLNMNNQIELRGLVNRKVISQQMSISHCFVLASKLETFGVAYAEAMAAGLPVISTRCGGPEEFINKKNGVLVPVDNKQALAGALRLMYENYRIYNCENISCDIKEFFGEKKVTEKIIEKYNDVIGINKKRKKNI